MKLLFLVENPITTYAMTYFQWNSTCNIGLIVHIYKLWNVVLLNALDIYYQFISTWNLRLSCSRFRVFTEYWSLPRNIELPIYKNFEIRIGEAKYPILEYFQVHWSVTWKSKTRMLFQQFCPGTINGCDGKLTKNVEWSDELTHIH